MPILNKEVWGNISYMGQGAAIREKAFGAVALTQKKSRRNRKLNQEEKIHNRKLARVNVKMEHIFGVTESLFGFAKARYKGLAKKSNSAYIVFLPSPTSIWPGGINAAFRDVAYPEIGGQVSKKTKVHKKPVKGRQRARSG
jgi:hypothetical protein